jgi:hypothetical protein
VLKLRTVDECALAVVPVADLARVNPEVLGHDPGPDLVQDVVPGKGTDLRVGTRPPEDAELMELEQPGPGPLDAGEVELVQLLGGKDPVFVKVDADELISGGE